MARTTSTKQRGSRSSAGWENARRDGDLTLRLPGGVELFFRRIPAGAFIMGSRGQFLDAREEPEHRVEISQDFYLATFPVTQEQWRAVASDCPSLRAFPNPSHFKGNRRPVERVDWFQAMEFTGWLTRFASLPAECRFARLPTEAEWEYACRAGTKSMYHTGDGAEALLEAGWFNENSDSGTQEVGRLTPNGFGLFDMHGNVWEWCFDAFTQRAYRRRLDGVKDPVVLASIRDWDRVLRGGSWIFDADGCRSASRVRDHPDGRSWDSGFRPCLVRSPAVHPYEQKGLFRG